VGEQIKLGQADFVAVEDYEYLISGVFGDDALSQAARKAIEADPEYYGLSIGYYYMPDKVQKLEVGDGITIPTYTDGVNHEVSVLAETDAACLYTGIFVQKEGVNRMNKKTKDELVKLAGDDPEALKMVDALAEKVDTINTDIEDKNLIRREQETAGEPVVEDAPVAPVTEPAPVPEQPAEFELSEDAMEAITDRVAGKLTTKFDEQLVEIRAANDKASADLDVRIAAIDARLLKIEKPLAEQVKTALEDMPRATAKMLYRPRERQAEQPSEDQPVSLEDIANETLANLK
jgi:hypothetical protein